MQLPDGATGYCRKTVGLSAAPLPFWQKLAPGTTAWRRSNNRRNAVEGVNGAMKGGFVNIQHKFFRVFGLTKMTVLLAFAIAGYNLECIRSFEARAAVDEAAASGTKTRAKRREGTWAALLGPGSPESGCDPPPEGETQHLI